MADDIVKPTAANWPFCLGSKNVKSAGTAEIFFSLCSTMGETTYQYTLHLDQKSPTDNVTVDVGIDPQIINKPHSIETPSKP
jgi:hypothetical protein